MQENESFTVTSTFQACNIIEDFDNVQPSVNEVFMAYAYLIKTGAAWKLQGFYGRNAAQLIKNQVISEEGEIL